MVERLITFAAGAAGLLYVADAIDKRNFLESAKSENGLAEVRSSVDGETYLVAGGAAAADLLARIRALAWQTREELRKRLERGAVPKEMRDAVARMLREVRRPADIRVAEMALATKGEKAPIAFNRNKGEMIMLCISGPEPGTLVRDDRALFVLLHELAHTMTSGYDPVDENGRTVHSEEFYACERYVYSVVAEMGIMHPRDQQGAAVCGTSIRHPRPDTLPQ